MSLLYLSEIPHAFPQEPTWQTAFVGIVGLLQHSFAARVSVRGHLSHHNCFQRRCTLHVLFEVDKHSPSWALRDRQLRSNIYIVAVGIRFAIRRRVSQFVTIPAVFAWLFVLSLPACDI